MRFARLRLVSVLIAFLAVPACAGDVLRPADDPRPGEAPLPMRISHEHGAPNRLHVAVQLDGRTRYVIVDSGTARFWLNASELPGRDEWITDAFTAKLGGSLYHVLGRRVPEFSETVHDQHPIGALGNDYLLAGTMVLDLHHGSIQRYPRGSKLGGVDRWPSVPFVLKRGILLVNLRYDGQPVRVILDTGAPETIWIGQHGKPGDIEDQSSDVHGNPIPYWRGTVKLGLGDALRERTVPVWRAPTFGHVAEIAEALHEKIDGILGLGALGEKQLVFDPAAGRLYFEP